MKFLFSLLALGCFHFLFAQTAPLLPEQKTADSLFSISEWKQAIPLYEKVLKQIPRNSLEWNRLGYCYHNTGNYTEAMNCYQKSYTNNPSAGLRPILESRMARVYSIQKNNDKAAEWMDSAANAGYANLMELETNADFASLRSLPAYKNIHEQVYVSVYPCMADSNARKFDFWVGEWDVHPNGVSTFVGKSKIEMVSGGCVILENWTSLVSAYSGKSMNFYIPSTGKWEQVWVGSEGSPTRPSIFSNGEYKDGAMRFDFSGKDQTGDFIGRFIFYNLGPDKVRQFSEQSHDAGKTWQTNYDFIYERKK